MEYKSLIGLIVLSGSIAASRETLSNRIEIPRFVTIPDEQSTYYNKKVDLLELLQKENRNIKLVNKDEVYDQAFQDEQDDNDFIEFDDFSVTVPVAMLEGHPRNFGL